MFHRLGTTECIPGRSRCTHQVRTEVDIRTGDAGREYALPTLAAFL